MEHQAKRKQKNLPEEPKSESESIDWWLELCKESNIHNMPYLARKDLHWIERFFWLAFIVASAYYAISSCYLQWERFRDNPIVYENEYLFALRNFTFLGVTLCTQYETEEQVNQIIQKTWALDPNLKSAEVAHYRNFLYVLNRLHYNNLHSLKPFENDSSLNNLNYVEMLIKLQQKVLPKAEYGEVLMAPIITEMGLCQTTSQLTRYGNPFGVIKNLNVTALRQCGFFTDCKLKHSPFNGVETPLQLYIHDVNGIMLPDDRQTVAFDTNEGSSYVLTLGITSITAENEVRNLPVAYRKCRYHDENNLKYFRPYHPSLCRLECRIRLALKFCGCRPFFYNLPKKAQICNVTGMLCLEQHNWLSQPCPCFPLCREVTYNIVEVFEQNGGGIQYVGEQFERTIILKLELPRMGMKRRVVFSTDQLIMSFGGAIGLFLGASFMTIYGLIYLFLYFLIVKCKCRPKRDKRREFIKTV